MPDGWRMMWLMVFYDLPVTSKAERFQARKFHEFLLRQGFERLHFSVYKRCCGTLERVLTFERRIEKALPPRGNVMTLRLTDRQITSIKRFVTGGYAADDTDPFEKPDQYVLL